MMEKKSITLICESDLDLLPLMGKAVRGVCSCVTQNESLLYQFELCVIEAITNCIKHAYLEEPNHFIELTITITQANITFMISDTGKTNTTVSKRELKINPLDIDNLPESGFGLNILYELMDEVSFFKEHDKNITLLQKNLNRGIQN